MNKKISIVSLGCSKNLIDSEIMLGLLEKDKFEINENIEESNIIIVNTCGFINDAKEESIEAILELSQFKTSGECECLIVTGCLSERYKEELLESMPEIDGMLGTGNVDEIVNIIEGVLAGEKTYKFGNIDSEYIEETYRKNMDTDSKTAYLKISEGCDNFCTYCVIPNLRGRYRSRKIENIIDEAKHLVKNGTREIILIAQDTGKYGIDNYGELKLPQLLDELEKIEELDWIRVLYLYPETITDELIDSIKRNKKVVHYLDIPIQHTSDSILKRMNRNIKNKEIFDIMRKLREEIKDIIIRTTIIVGFPGESDEDFNRLKKDIGSIEFDKLGVFTFSREKDTEAYDFEDQIDEEIKERRKKEIMLIQEEISERILRKKVGNNYKTLIEEKIEENIYTGRTYMDSPEVDGIVYIESSIELEIGSFVTIRIKDSLEYDLVGGV